MDVNDKDKFEMDKRDDSPMDYSSSALMSSDFQFTLANVVNSSLGQVPPRRGGASSGLSASMARTSIPGLWDTIVSAPTIGFCDINAPHVAGVSSAMGMRIRPPLGSGSDGTLEWHPSNSTLEGSIFLPHAPGTISQSVARIPADSAFVEHVPKFLSFNDGNFTEMLNHFQIPGSLGPCSEGGSTMQGQFEVVAGSRQAQKCGMNVAEASMDAPLPTTSVATSEGPLKNNSRSEGLVTSMDEAKRCASWSGNESYEAAFSRGQDEPAMFDGGESSAKSLGLKKRKRNMQDYNLGKVNQHSGESYKDSPDIQQKTDKNPTPTANKTMGKQGKQVLQTPDPPKEEYILVRARRGQTTNSHSLAERVRREKISERMKLLQDLVPGCSKVTGKAVMLDEIINYVQSLQRQVELLSMKLATVNPRLDFNLEELLAKDIIQPRAVSLSSLAFSPDMSMVYPPLHPSQPRDITAGLTGMESPAHVLRRSVFPQLTPMAGAFKDNPQPVAWDDQLHNVIQRSYGTTAPQDNQDTNGEPN